MSDPDKFHLKGLGVSIELAGKNAIHWGALLAVLLAGLLVLFHYA